MVKKHLHIAARQTFYLIAIAIVLFLTGLLAAVWLSEEIARRKDEIATWVSQQAGYPVEIGQASLYLFKLVPKLELREVKILQTDSTQAWFQAGQIHLGLDLKSTLAQQFPVFGNVDVQNAQFTLLRDEQGHFAIAGLQAAATARPASVKSVVDKVGWLQQLQLKKIHIDYQDAGYPALSGSYNVQQLQLRVNNGKWRLQSLFALPGQLGRQLEMNGWAQLDEQAKLTTANWQMAAQDLQLATLMGGQAVRGIVFQQGAGSFDATFSYDSEKQFQAGVDLELKQLIMTSATGDKQTAEPVSLNYYRGFVSWQQQNDNWSLSIPDQRVVIGRQSWPVSTFKINHDDNGRIHVDSDYIKLSDISAFAKLLEDAPEFLIKAWPAGEISHLALDYDPAQGITALSLTAVDLGVLPWQSYPGVNNLSFKLDWQQGRAKVNFDSHKTMVFAQSWLEEPAYLESLTGELRLSRQQQNWQLELTELRLLNDDFSIQVDGYLSQQQQQLDSQIKLNLQDVAVNRWKAYVPQRILSDDFKRWSANAFVDGYIVNGTINMQGDPAAFPFDTEPDKGAFHMQLQTENVQLHYGPGWPDLKQINAHISGQGNNLLITSQSAMIAGLNIVECDVQINNLVGTKPVLTASGKVTGGSGKTLAFLNNSPLRKRFGELVDWLALSGQSKVDLKLHVPLTSVDDTDVTGQVSFKNTRLKTKAVPGLTVKNVTGSLQFNNRGVTTAENIKAKVFGRPVAIKVMNKSPQTWVELRGKTAISNLKSLWQDVVPDFVSGQTGFLTRLIIEEKARGDFGVEVDVHSNLKGVSVNAPQPLSKAAAEQAKFNLKIASLADDRPSYRLQYRDSLSAFLNVDKEQKLHGEFVLGGGQAALRKNGLAFVARLEQLEMDKWLNWRSGQKSSTSSFLQQLDSLFIGIDSLTVFEQDFDAVRVTGQQQNGLWTLDLAARQFNGQVRVAADRNEFTALEADLHFLRISLPEKDGAYKTESMPLWPALKINIEQLQVDGIELGQLQADAERLPQQWLLKSATLNSPLYFGKISGSWSQQQHDSSHFMLEGSSRDLKKLLAKFDYQQIIDARDVKLNGDLSWTGNPLAISPEKVQGMVQLSAGRGELLEVEPGAAGRIFGLFSIAALPRHLSLDFGDLFTKGFHFSSIKSSFNLRQGIANTDNFVMNGDSALIEITGPINLIEESYDQSVKVTPQVSSTLPIAGAVAGGPAGIGIGTAIMLVDKLVDEVFNKNLVDVVSYQYRLSGPWEDPEFNIEQKVAN